MRIGIKPTVDVVFKKIFASPKHEEITRDFLNSLFPLAGVPEVTHIDILNPFKLAEFVGNKEITVDIHAKDADDREIQIEMQVRNDEALSSRMLDNWARLYSEQIEKGHDYREHHPLIALWILGQNHFKDEEWLHVFRANERASGLALSADLVIVSLELGKWEKWKALSSLAETDKFESSLDEWLWFLAEGEEIDPEGAGYGALRDAIREAVEIMRVFTKKDKARYTYERRLDWERTINAWKIDSQKAGHAEGLAEGREVGHAEGLAEGREVGLAEGLAEGREVGLAEGQRKQSLEDARKFKELGVSIEVIATATGLSEVEVEAL
jgi:predicted transposase/invertase (TIGR01784 family)